MSFFYKIIDNSFLYEQTVQKKNCTQISFELNNILYIFLGKLYRKKLKWQNFDNKNIWDEKTECNVSVHSIIYFVWIINPAVILCSKNDNIYRKLSDLLIWDK